MLFLQDSFQISTLSHCLIEERAGIDPKAIRIHWQQYMKGLEYDRLGGRPTTPTQKQADHLVDFVLTR
jgi:hypothetical protein